MIIFSTVSWGAIAVLTAFLAVLQTHRLIQAQEQLKRIKQNLWNAQCLALEFLEKLPHNKDLRNVTKALLFDKPITKEEREEIETRLAKREDQNATEKS